MKAITYKTSGDADVMALTDRDVPEPGPGEVRVAVRVSGVNPTDWKARSSTTPKTNAIRTRTDAIKIGSFTFAGKITAEESVASPSNVRMIPRRLDVTPPIAPITNNVTNDTRIHPCAHALICAPR